MFMNDHHLFVDIMFTSYAIAKYLWEGGTCSADIYLYLCMSFRQKKKQEEETS